MDTDRWRHRLFFMNSHVKSPRWGGETIICESHGCEKWNLLEITHSTTVTSVVYTTNTSTHTSLWNYFMLCKKGLIITACPVKKRSHFSALCFRTAFGERVFSELLFSDTVFVCAVGGWASWHTFLLMPSLWLHTGPRRSPQTEPRPHGGFRKPIKCFYSPSCPAAISYLIGHWWADLFPGMMITTGRLAFPEPPLIRKEFQTTAT